MKLRCKVTGVQPFCYHYPQRPPPSIPGSVNDTSHDGIRQHSANTDPISFVGSLDGAEVQVIPDLLGVEPLFVPGDQLPNIWERNEVLPPQERLGECASTNGCRINCI